jgi:hypothetical protein
MKNVASSLMSALVVLLACSVVVGQNADPPAAKVNVSGKLLSPKTGLPAVGVKLSLVDPGEFFTNTDAGGQFIFRGVPTGTYRYLFAYERGGSKPQQTVLLKKKIVVSALTNEPLILLHEPLLERSREKRGEKIANLQFLDNRPREHYQAILLEEPLGIGWPEQYLSLNIRFPLGACRRPSLRVMDGKTGFELPFQITNPIKASADFLNGCTITFPAKLEPFKSKIYAICADWRGQFQPPKYPTDLKVEARDKLGAIELYNAMCAVRIPADTQGKPKTLKGSYPAPVMALRGPDGVWFGSGELVTSRKPVSYSCEEEENGPVFRQFKIIYKFDAVDAEKEEDRLGPAEYRVVLRMYAKRDFFSIREAMIGDIDLTVRIHLSKNFSPNVGFYADNGNPVFRDVTAQPKSKDPIMLAAFRAWNPPGVRTSHNWYGLASSGDRKDAFGVVQVNGSYWQSADRRYWLDGTWISKTDDQTEVRLMVTPELGFYVDLPHRAGSRELLLALFDKNRNWDPTTMRAKLDPKVAATKSHYLNRLHIAHSQLNVYKLKTLLAGGNNINERPRLLFKVSSYAAFKEAFDKDPSRFPIVMHDVFTDSRVHTNLTRRRILAGVLDLRRAIAGPWNTKAITGYSGKMADLRRLTPLINYTALLYDVNAKSGLFSAREKETIEATLAAAAAQLADSNFVSLFSYDPGLTAHRDTALTILSLLLDKHPQSSSRVLSGRRRLEFILRQARRAGGLSLNTGAYTVALNLWAQTDPIFRSASGIGDVGGSPLVADDFHRALLDLVRLTTPPDRRYGGVRLLPTLGRARAGDRESLAVLGLTAAAIARTKPTLAAQYAWAWRQAGRPVYEGLSSYQGMLDVRGATDPGDIKPQQPEKIRSSVLNGLGVVLRAHFMKPEEAYLLFRCSPLMYSQHNDRGSLLYYAFGTPLLADTGTPPTRRAAWAHNTFRIDQRPVNAPGEILALVDQDTDVYTAGSFKVEAVSQHREYTPPEFAKLKAMAKPFTPPPGHLADGRQTMDLLPATRKLDRPVEITRHVLLSKQRQYLVVLDRFRGDQATDVFYNVLAQSGRLSDGTAQFAGSHGVDMEVHAFGSHSLKPSIFQDVPGRWVLRLSQPAPPAPKDAAAKAATVPVVEYLTVLCPVRRGSGFAAPKVEKLKDVTGVRIAHGKTVRYVFFADKPIEYQSGDVQFKGQRGIVTIRPTHFDVALYDAGEIRYKGVGIRVDAGMATFRIAPGGFIDGEVRGPKPKRITLLGMGRSPRRLSYRVDSQEHLGKGDASEARYAVTHGLHSVNVTPK